MNLLSILLNSFINFSDLYISNVDKFLKTLMFGNKELKS